MEITPDPVLTTVEFGECEKIHSIMVKDEKVIDFGISQRWFVSKVTVDRSRTTLVITVERNEDEQA